MTRDPVTCEPTTTLRVVATLMLDHDCAAVPIVSSGEWRKSGSAEFS